MHHTPAASVIIGRSVRRRRAQGDIGDADLHGSQQHAPVMAIEIP
jgi:hypothetical protein